MLKSQPRDKRLCGLAASILLGLAIAAPAHAGRAELGGLQTDTQFDQFIIKYKADAPERRDPALRQRGLDRAVAATNHRFKLRHKRAMSFGMDVLSADRKLGRTDTELLLRQLAADPNVESVEIDTVERGTSTPNDPRYNEQWHYYNPVSGINAPAAWDKATGSAIVVAVVDSGKIAHADLAGQFIGGYDFVTATGTGGGGSCDGNGRDADPTDVCNVQHGTHIAGTIAALTNNGVGVAGVAHNAKIVPVRVLGAGNSGQSSDIADGINWAAGGSVPGAPANPDPAEVINISIGGTNSCGSAYQAAIDSATALGATLVITAGNNNTDASNQRPANCSGTFIVVAANDIGGNRASYSNYGSIVDVTAPGGETSISSEGILSTVSNNGYAFWQGTSMAAPHVTATVALIQSAVQTPKTPAQIEQILKASARPMPGSCSGGCGAGIIDASAAIDVAINGTPPPAAAPSGLGVAYAGKSGKTSSYQLNWSGGGAAIDVYRNGAKVQSGIANTGSAIDKVRLSGSGTLTYKACNAGTADCSANASINY